MKRMSIGIRLYHFLAGYIVTLMSKEKVRGEI